MSQVDETVRSMLVKELRGWNLSADMSDDACRKVWLMRRAADEIERLAPPHERSEGEPTERPGAVDPYTKGLHAGREEMRERAVRHFRTIGLGGAADILEALPL